MRSMREALRPLMKALISDELLKHSEEDVKVTVTSCITEITRITAPDAPYDDDKMKVSFKLLILGMHIPVDSFSYFFRFHWRR